jgi:hypothetical protein
MQLRESWGVMNIPTDPVFRLAPTSWRESPPVTGLHSSSDFTFATWFYTLKHKIEKQTGSFPQYSLPLLCNIVREYRHGGMEFPNLELIKSSTNQPQ